MRIHDGTITLTDRVALSNDLFALARKFIAEADKWQPQHARAIVRPAGILGELARGVLNGSANFTVAEAYYDAGSVLLARKRSERMFLTAVLTPPYSTDGDPR